MAANLEVSGNGFSAEGEKYPLLEAVTRKQLVETVTDSEY
jgi:hypothetical protein